ncbi:MAG TPA: hypothetical protein C5S37_05535 [Methanophagales archaeon]|nr:hypothetical protein [Methanophagales archaeon]
MGKMKKIWVICIIALLASGTAVAIVAMCFEHYKKLSMATDIEKGSISSEPIIIVNESNKSEEISEDISQNQKEPGSGSPSGGEIEKRQAELDKLHEITMNDSKVQELIEGKSYTVTSGGMTSADIGEIILKIDEKHYIITIDLNSETVESVEEFEEQKVPK